MVTSIFADARLWHDKTYGNTYFSVKVFVDGDHLFTLPMDYGYGSQWKHVTLLELQERGIIPVDVNGGLERACRESDITLYTSESYGLKRDMWK